MIRTRRWLLVAPSMLLLWVIGQFDKTNISLVIANQDFLQELHLAGRNAELGGLMSTFFVGYGVSVFLWGFLVDKFGPRKCLIAGTLLWGAVMFSMSFATSLSQLLAARFLLGAAEGNLWPVSNSLTNRWFPTKEHSRAQTFWLAGANLGTAIGVPIVSALLLSSGWRAMLVVLAAISVVPLVFFAFISNRPAKSVDVEERKTTHIAKMSFGELLRTKAFWLLACCMVIAMTTIYTMVQWLPRFLTTQRGLSTETMASWITVGYLISTVLAVVGGYFADRTMMRGMTAAWACLLFAVLVMPAALWLPGVPAALALSTLIAVPGLIGALNGALLHQMVKPEGVARGTGIYSGCGSILSAAGPVIFGSTITWLDGDYWGGFVFLAAMNIIGAVCYYALHLQERGPVATSSAPATEPLPSAS